MKVGTYFVNWTQEPIEYGADFPKGAASENGNQLPPKNSLVNPEYGIYIVKPHVFDNNPLRSDLSKIVGSNVRLRSGEELPLNSIAWSDWSAVTNLSAYSVNEQIEWVMAALDFGAMTKRYALERMSLSQDAKVFLTNKWSKKILN